MMHLNLALPEEIKAFIDAQVAQGGHASASDYLLALIREAQEHQAKRDLEAELLEGLQSPASEMTGADWAGLRERILERSPELRGEA